MAVMMKEIIFSSKSDIFKSCDLIGYKDSHWDLSNRFK
jgi:hypothetical protein